MLNLLFDWILGSAAARRAERITPDGARGRARRGAAFLDDVMPGWAGDVDALSLDLSRDGACVLGHLHGSFALGLGRSGVFSVSSAPRASFSPVELGFYCMQGVSEELQEKDYDYLNRAWRAEILARLSQGDGAADYSKTLNVTPVPMDLLPSDADTCME